MSNNKQDMSCKGCRQKAIKCSKCIRRVTEYWDIRDNYITDKQSRECKDCISYKTDGCPNSGLCYSVDSKPYWGDRTNGDN